jgi:selenoprotein W-related protein
MSDLSLNPTKYHVSIEYCVPCDYSAHAFRVTKELLGNYQHVIDRLELITGSNGAFEVLVDGEPLFSKKETQRHPEPGEVLQLFKEIVGPQPGIRWKKRRPKC